MEEPETDELVRTKLKTQLHVLEKAIELISDIDHRVDEKPKGVVINTSQDNSFVIDTASTQKATCPDCFREIDYGRLKLHRHEECGNRIVTCPNVGCGQKLHKNNLSHHLSYECFSAVTRKKYLQSALEKATRKIELEHLFEDSGKSLQHQTPSILDKTVVEKPILTEKKIVFCSNCGEGLSESKLQHHLDNLCICRAIACPNFGNGCTLLRVPFNQLAMHLLNDCNTEKYKNQLIAKSAKRSELILCSTCGYQLELRLWRKHEKELCENRLVPCKNQQLGCPVMVPLNERELHESIDERYQRHCLYFSGHGTCLHVDEADVLCPWTAEDSLSFHLRNLFSLFVSYELAYCSECFARERVMGIVNALKRESSLSKETGKSISKQERKRLQNEQMQIKVNLLNELSALIPVYADAVLAYFRAFQSVAICIEAAMDCIRDLATASRESWDPESEISFEDTYHEKFSSRGVGEAETGNDHFDPQKLYDRVQTDPVANSLFLHGKSSVAQYFKFCFFEALFTSDSNLTNSPIHQMFITEHRNISDKLGKLLGYTQLPDLPIRHFLLLVILQPRIGKDRSFKARAWNRILDCLATLLKLDFDELQDGRIEAGLITPDTTSKTENHPQKKADKEAEAGPDGRDSAEKKRRKKEREKQRRELSKLQNESEVSTKAVETTEGATKLSSMGEEPDTGTKNTTGKSTTEMKLIDRVTDLLKSGCGCEIIGESSTVNSLHHRSHICLSMYSGLSLLFKNNSEANTNLFTSSPPVEKDHFYELIIHSRDLDRFREMTGQVGFVSVSDESQGVSSEKEGNSIFNILRVQAIATEAKVQRGRWTHLAVTAMKEPQNRVVCLMDGFPIGSFRNCSFPLPMLSIGGSPLNLFSFSGVLLDVRLWDYVRTSLQIQESMHRLIDVSLHRIENFAAMDDSASHQNQSSHSEKSRGAKQSDDNGLIAYWTMEDGPGSDYVTDVTRHRFKTRIISRFPLNFYWNGSEAGKYDIPDSIVSDFPPILARLRNGNFKDTSVDPRTTRENLDSNRDLKEVSSRGLLRYFGEYFWVAAGTIKVYLSLLSADMRQQFLSSPRRHTGMAKTSKYPSYLQQEMAGSDGDNCEDSIPVPSYREKNICPFELHRLRLARKGRELQNYVICPLNCTQAVRKLSLRFHLQFQCLHRFVSCSFDGCNAVFPLNERENHERFGCIVSKGRERILRQADLQNRIISCERCGELVKLRHLERHTEYECVHRLVFCSNDDCVMGKSRSEAPQLPLSLLQRHLKYDCKSPSKEKRYFLISRSRRRSPYPRPWGISIEVIKAE